MLLVLLVLVVVGLGSGVVVLQLMQQFGGRVVPPPGGSVVGGLGTAQPVYVGPGHPVGGGMFGGMQPQPVGPEQSLYPSIQYSPSIGHHSQSPTHGGVGGTGGFGIRWQLTNFELHGPTPPNSHTGQIQFSSVQSFINLPGP